MVGIDALSQQTSAVQQLSEHHEIPVCAVHAPCLLFTQRVWGTEPVGQARAVRRDGRRGRRRGGRRAPAVPLAAGVRRAGSSTGIAALEESTGIAFAVENMYPWRASTRRGMEMYLPGWDPSERALRQHHDRPLARRDRARPTRSRWPSGSATGCGTSTSPTAPARRRTSTWCPAAASIGAGDVPRSTWPATGFAGDDRARDQHPQVRRPASEREADLRGVAGVRPRALRGDGADDRHRVSAPPGSPSGRAPTPGRRSSPRRASAFAGAGASAVRRSAAVAADAGVDAGAGAPLLRHARTTCSSPRSSCRSTRARCSAPALAGGVDGAAERLLTRRSSSVWDDPDARGRALLARRRAASSSPAASAADPRGLPAGGAPARSATALGVDRPERRMPLVASQVIGLILVRYVLGSSRSPRCRRASVVATYAPHDPALPGRCPLP